MLLYKRMEGTPSIIDFMDGVHHKISKNIDKKTYEKRGHLIKILEKFVQENNVVLYGGGALNYYLKEPLYEDELFDFDMYSKNPDETASKLKEAIELAGFNSKVTGALHEGTKKVYAGAVQIADITKLNQNLENSVFKNRQIINGFPVINERLLFHGLAGMLSKTGSSFKWEKAYPRLIEFISQSKIYNPLNYPTNSKLIVPPTWMKKLLSSFVLGGCFTLGMMKSTGRGVVRIPSRTKFINIYVNDDTDFMTSELAKLMHKIEIIDTSMIVSDVDNILWGEYKGYFISVIKTKGYCRTYSNKNSIFNIATLFTDITFSNVQGAILNMFDSKSDEFEAHVRHLLKYVKTKTAKDKLFNELCIGNEDGILTIKERH